MSNDQSSIRNMMFLNNLPNDQINNNPSINNINNINLNPNSIKKEDKSNSNDINETLKNILKTYNSFYNK
jgi:hypothetical protein